MKLLFLILVSVIVNSSNAQTKDPFTGQLKSETQYQMVVSSGWSAMQCKIKKVDSSYYLISNGTGKGNELINTDDRLMFLMVDSSTVSLYPTEMQMSGLESYFHYYKMPAYERSLLAAQPIKKIRKYTAAGYIDWDVKPKHSTNIQKLLSIIK